VEDNKMPLCTYTHVPRPHYELKPQHMEVVFKLTSNWFTKVMWLSISTIGCG